MEIGNSLGSKINFAGANFDANAVVLSCGLEGSAVYSVLKDSEGNDYQVPAGKTLRIKAVQWMTASTIDFGVGYADNSIGYSSTPAPTNHVKYCDKLNCFDLPATANQPAVLLEFDVPAGKYPTMYKGPAALLNITAICELI